MIVAFGSSGASRPTGRANSSRDPVAIVRHGPDSRRGGTGDRPKPRRLLVHGRRRRVLFLVPMPWVGPVWAPIVVSAALVVVGLAAARRLRAERPVVVSPRQALAALAGGGLVILSFLVDTNRVLPGDSAAWTGWPLFWAGMALPTTATLTALIGRPTAAAPRGMPPQHGSEVRPPAGSPE